MLRGLEQLAGRVRLQTAGLLQVNAASSSSVSSVRHTFTCNALSSSLRYVESFFVSLTSVEQDLRSDLVAINLSQSQIIKLQNATTIRWEERGETVAVKS